MDWGVIIIILAGAVLWFVIDRWVLPYRQGAGG